MRRSREREGRSTPARSRTESSGIWTRTAREKKAKDLNQELETERARHRETGPQAAREQLEAVRTYMVDAKICLKGQIVRQREDQRDWARQVRRRYRHPDGIRES